MIVIKEQFSLSELDKVLSKDNRVVEVFKLLLTAIQNNDFASVGDNILKTVYAESYTRVQEHVDRAVYQEVYKSNTYSSIIDVFIGVYSIIDAIIQNRKNISDISRQDAETVKAFLDSYGFSINQIFTTDTQKEIAKNIYYYLRRKGTGYILSDMLKKLGIDNYTINEYYLTRYNDDWYFMSTPVTWQPSSASPVSRRIALEDLDDPLWFLSRTDLNNIFGYEDAQSTSSSGAVLPPNEITVISPADGSSVYRTNTPTSVFNLLGTSSTTYSGDTWPGVISVGPDGKLYSTDSSTGDLMRFNSDGSFDTYVTINFGEFEVLPLIGNTLWGPDGKLYVQGEKYVPSPYSYTYYLYVVNPNTWSVEYVYDPENLDLGLDISNNQVGTHIRFNSDGYLWYPFRCLLVDQTSYWRVAVIDITTRTVINTIDPPEQVPNGIGQNVGYNAPILLPNGSLLWYFYNDCFIQSSEGDIVSSSTSPSIGYEDPSNYIWTGTCIELPQLSIIRNMILGPDNKIYAQILEYDIEYIDYGGGTWGARFTPKEGSTVTGLWVFQLAPDGQSLVYAYHSPSSTWGLGRSLQYGEGIALGSDMHLYYMDESGLEDDTWLSTLVVLSQDNSSVMLFWSCSDPNGYALTYDVYFGTNEINMVLIAGGITDTSLAVPVSTHFSYCWKVVATNTINESTETKTLSFSIANEFPYITNLSPANNAVDQPSNGTLSWSVVDPDGDTVYTDVYLGESNTPDVVEEGNTTQSYAFTGLRGHTTYYWQVRSSDDYGATTSSEIYRFTTANNLPEFISIEGTPSSSTITLSWEVEDVDDDTLYYDVYFGETGSEELVASNISETSWTPDFELTVGNIYSFYVVAKDGYGQTVSTTESTQLVVSWWTADPDEYGFVTTDDLEIYVERSYNTKNLAVDSDGCLIYPRYEEGALSKFDPNTSEETVLVPDVDAYNVMITPDGKIWFVDANTYYLNWYNPATETYGYSTSGTFSTYGLDHMQYDANGDIWLVGRDYYLYFYDVSEDTATQIAGSRYVTQLVPSPDRTKFCYYISSAGYYFDINTKTPHTMTGVTLYTHVIFGDNDTLWFGRRIDSSNHPLCYYTISTNTYHDISSTKFSYSEMVCDPSGKIWYCDSLVASRQLVSYDPATSTLSRKTGTNLYDCLVINNSGTKLWYADNGYYFRMFDIVGDREYSFSGIYAATTSYVFDASDNMYFVDYGDAIGGRAFDATYPS